MKISCSLAFINQSLPAGNSRTTHPLQDVLLFFVMSCGYHMSKHVTLWPKMLFARYYQRWPAASCQQGIYRLSFFAFKMVFTSFWGENLFARWYEKWTSLFGQVVYGYAKWISVQNYWKRKSVCLRKANFRKSQNNGYFKHLEHERFFCDWLLFEKRNKNLRKISLQFVLRLSRCHVLKKFAFELRLKLAGLRRSTALAAAQISIQWK